MSPDLSKYLSLRSPLLYIGFALAMSLGVGSYAWYGHLTAEGETVAGNVEYAGMRVGGLTAADARREAVDRSLEILTGTVTIETPSGDIEVQLNELGFAYDTDLAVNRILWARHRGGPVEQFVAWIGTMAETETIDEPVSFDRELAIRAMSSIPGLVFEPPVEPGVAVDDEFRLAVIPGEPGVVADIEDLADQLGGLDPLSEELVVSAAPEALAPGFSDARAQTVVDQLNELTGRGIRLTLGGIIRQMAPAAIRRHLDVTIKGEEMVAAFNLPGLQAEIEDVFRGPIGVEVNPSFEVDGDTVTLVEPGIPPEVCCSLDTSEKIGNAILDGADGPFALTTRPSNDATLASWYDGSLVVEQVSSFTTPHSCCENRVVNIQRMADIVRGYYLVPGEILSLNDYVGPRTTEKGFVPAGAIRAGHLTPEIGGGVSQFATTIFNAAYFAGLDFVEYQAHSLYFSRYPYGREATISNPAPDLVFENTTDYPILIWTSYTGTSITVSMYSTKHIQVEQIATRTSPISQCTYVETDRERIYPDGERVIDTFFAVYRPADGIDCNGNPIPVAGE